jgi:hypothetical protein
MNVGAKGGPPKARIVANDHDGVDVSPTPAAGLRQSGDVDDFQQ